MNINDLKRILYSNTELPDVILDIISEYGSCNCNKNKRNHHKIYYVKCKKCDTTDVTTIRPCKYYCYYCRSRIIPTYLKKKCKICHNCINDDVHKCLDCKVILIKYNLG